MFTFRDSQLKVFSNVFSDLAAGWIAAIVITPNFTDVPTRDIARVLILDAVFAIVFVMMAVYIEDRL